MTRKRYVKLMRALITNSYLKDAFPKDISLAPIKDLYRKNCREDYFAQRNFYYSMDKTPIHPYDEYYEFMLEVFK